MKRTILIIGLMIALISVPSAMAAPQPPYPLDGYVVYENGTVVGGANITFTNPHSEVIYDDSSLTTGWYSVGAGDFPTDYADGDVIQYYTVFGSYTNTTTYTLNTTEGSHTMNITLEQGGAAPTPTTGWTPRATTSTHQTPLNESAYNKLDDSLQAANPKWTDFTDAIAKPYLDQMGSIFFLFLFGVPLLMLYIRQDSVNIPATTVFLFGAFVIVLLPPQWRMIGRALLALALFGAFFSFMKERERG